MSRQVSASLVPFGDLKIAEPKGNFKNIALFRPHPRENEACAPFHDAIKDAAKEKPVNVKSLAFNISIGGAALGKLRDYEFSYGRERLIASAYDVLFRAEIIVKYLKANKNSAILELHASPPPINCENAYEMWERVGETNIKIRGFSRTLKRATNILRWQGVKPCEPFDSMAKSLGYGSMQEIFDSLISYKKILSRIDNRALVLELPCIAAKTFQPLLTKDAVLVFGEIKYTFTAL